MDIKNNLLSLKPTPSLIGVNLVIIMTVYDSLIPASYRTDSLKCYILKSNR